jgi:hypothetical protein
MSKPYHLMTVAERLADRISKNKAIEQNLLRAPLAGLCRQSSCN